MSKQNEIVDLELHQHFITERAIRVSKDGDDKTAVWLPLSKIDVECVRGNVVMVTLPTWLATERGVGLMWAFPIRYEHLFRHESGVRSTYMKRLTIGRLNLHLFYRGDGDEAPHDHPWSFWSFPLADYLEEVYDPIADRRYVQVVPRFAWHYRPARHVHRVLGRASWIEGVGYVVAPGKWATIVWNTAKQREWGSGRKRAGGTGRHLSPPAKCN